MDINTTTLAYSKIKDKYGIKKRPTSKMISPEEYNQSQAKIQSELDTLFKTIDDDYTNLAHYKKICQECLEKNTDFRILELWEDPEPGTFIKSVIKSSTGEINFIKGYVDKATPLEIFYKPTIGSKTIRRVPRFALILTKYTSSQMSLMEIHKMITPN